MKATVNELLLAKKRFIHNNTRLNAYQKRHLMALARCRTKYLGGRKLQCSVCAKTQIVYNSCRNRHCPLCQNSQKEQWIAARENDVLPIQYFHLVFTLPSELNGLALAYPKAVYNALFKASWDTLASFSEAENFKTGMTCILHTWGQNLSLHPHLHCIVPSGGLSENGEWKSSKSKGKFLFPVKALSQVFRAKYMAQLRLNLKAIGKTVPQKIAKSVFSKHWVVYAKQPFGGPKQVIEYLGRYSHKVAISNHRIESIKDGKVTFKYKDYRAGSKVKTMRLSSEEFIRRFSQHILPNRFVRIRHYGILSSRIKKDCLTKIRALLDKSLAKWEAKEKQNYKAILLEKYQVDVTKCKQCKQGILQEQEHILPIKIWLS